MSKRSVVILITCTIILAVASVVTIYNEPEIESAHISSDINLALDESRQRSGVSYFDDSDSNVYLILAVKNLSVEDEIKINWKILEGNSEKIIQENIIQPEENGSGEMIVSLVRKNKKLIPCSYTVEVFLNNDKKITKKFIVVK